MSEAQEVVATSWRELSQIAGTTTRQQDSSLAYLLLERVGGQLRLLNSRSGDGTEEAESIHSTLKQLELSSARRVGNTLMREAAKFYAPSINSTEVSITKFREAHHQFERMVCVWMGLSRWNTLNEKTYYVQGGPLFYEIGLIMKALLHEYGQLERTAREHPDLEFRMEPFVRDDRSTKSD